MVRGCEGFLIQHIGYCFIMEFKSPKVVATFIELHLRGMESVISLNDRIFPLAQFNPR